MTPRTPELQRLAAARPTLAWQTSILVTAEERQRFLDTVIADPSRVRPPRRELHFFRVPLVAVSDATSGARLRLRTTVSRHTRMSVAVALLALIAASGAIANAAGVVSLPAFWQQEPAAPSPYGIAPSIPTDLASSFAILRRPRQPAIDALPAAGAAAITAGPGGQHYGVNTDLSRYVGAINGTSFWLVSGNLGSCVYTSNEGTTCTSNSRVGTEGTVALLVPVAAGADTFLGIVPDDATVTAANTDGSTAPVLRSGDAYMVTDDSSLHSVTVHESNGQAETNYAPTVRAPSNDTAPSNPTQGG